MSQDNVNINISETIDNINIISSETTEVIDINVMETTEDITLNITEEVIQVNVNKVTSTFEQIQSDWNETDENAIDFIKNKPSIPSINGLATTSYVDTQDAFKVDKVAGKSLILDSEITRLAGVTNFDNSGNVTALGNKVDKITGKGLSTEDYTTSEKNKLAGIQEGAEINVNADWNATNGDAQILNKPTIPTSLPPNGTAGGDLQGTYPNPVVHQIQGQSVQNGNPADNDFLVWDNTASMWKHIQLAYDRIISALGYTPANKAGETFSGAISATNLSGTNTGNETLTSIATINHTSTAKTTLIDADEITGQNSASSFALMRVTCLNLYNYLKSKFDSVYTTTTAVATQITTALSGYATQTYVNSQGFITNVVASLGYTPENIANKSTSTADSGSSIKFPVWSAIVSYFSASQIRSILGISTLSGSNTGDQDLSSLATKSMSAYSFRVNNTNATANATETTYKSIGQQAYTGTITWTGTTPPSGATSFSYNWSQIGNLVTLKITLVYANAGTLLTAVNMTLPSDCPTPLKPTGLSSANNILYIGVGFLGINLTAVPSATARVILKSNSSNNGFEILSTAVAAAYLYSDITIQYYTS